MALSITNKESSTLKDLVKKIKSFHTDDWGRYRIAFRWVAEHIAYDVVSYRSNKIEAQSPQETIQKKRAVCEGYAELLKAIADGLGIRCEVISGYAKWDGVCQEKYDKANHAWNAAEINGSWYLFDATWAAGNVDLKINRFKRIFEDFYFAPAPEELLNNHLPEDPKWQLVVDTLAKAEFESRCSVSVALFKLGLTVEAIKRICPASRCEMVEINYESYNNISKAEIPFEKVLHGGMPYEFTIRASGPARYYIENAPPAILPAKNEKVIPRATTWTSTVDSERNRRRKTDIPFKKNISRITFTPLVGYLCIFSTEKGRSEIIFKWTVQ